MGTQVAHDTGEQKPANFAGWLPAGESLPQDAFETRHSRVTLAALAHIPFLAALGVFTGTMSVTEAVIPATPLWVVVAELTALVVVAVTARTTRLPRRVRTGLSALAWMLATMQLVQFSGGYIEAHFHFFVAIGVLASYEDWLPFGFGLLYVVVGHGMFATVLDASRVYNHSAAVNNPWVWGGIHGVFVLMLAVSELSNWRSITESRKRSERRLERVEEQKAEMESIEEAKAKAEERRHEVEELRDALEARAEEYRTTMEAAANGDLTARLDPCDQSEAMAKVAIAFNDTMDAVEDTVDDAKSFATAVQDEASATVQRVQDAQTEAEEVADTIESIADQAAAQRDDLSQAAQEMNTLSATIEEVASSASNVAETADETAAVAAEGTDAVEETVDRTDAMQVAVSDTVDTVAVVDEEMQEIESTVEMIGEIAEQTDMLALNAAIEAARAGDDAGDGGSDGFAVVAEEVKQLAGEAQDAATSIETRIEAVRNKTNDAVAVAENAATEAQEATEVVSAAGDKFHTVTNHVEETTNGVTEISHATDDQAASTEETVSIVEDALATSEHTADTAVTAAEASAEQATVMGDVVAEAESLVKRASDLEDALNEFTTTTTSGPATGAQQATQPALTDGAGE